MRRQGLSAPGVAAQSAYDARIVNALVVAALVVAIVAVFVAVAIGRRLQMSHLDLRERGARVIELERTTAELLTRQRRVLTSLDHLQLGFVVTDNDGREAARNHAAAVLLGDHPSQAVAMTALDEVLLEARNGVAGTQTVELFGPPRRVVVIYGAHVDDGAVAVIEDVTERRRIDAIRRDFVSNISHELRTPVGALLLLSETLSDSADDEDPIVVRKLASRVELEANRLTAMVDDLLSLARIEANDPSGYVTLRIDDLIRDAVDRSESSSERFGVPIEIGDGTRGLLVVGDRAQLLSAIHNLVENAIKYSDKGLAIVVSADLDDSAHTVRISVTDRGIGIPARDRERIFERFYRVDRARARDTGGTGLGLAIVRHIAVNHGGDITVRSLEGDGSTFTLTLPQRVDQ